ncbi:MAG: hypothetical protein HeimC2_44210, partial [Candidatus Heimdallarchaeota archaeon LC_2]
MFTNKPEKEENYILDLIRVIIHKLSNQQIKEFSFNQFIKDKSNDELNYEFWNKVRGLVQYDFKNDSSIYEFQNENIEKLAKWFQNSLEYNMRKDYAANYTSISAVKVMNHVYSAKEHDRIIDPFCGSGRLLMGFLKSLPKNAKFPNITINEYMLLPCLLSYYDLICYYKANNADVNKITVKLGDAFENFKSEQAGKFDLVLMNPPFTRIHRINPETRKNIDSLISPYPNLTIGQPGLHYFALILANNLLKSNGKVVSILPAATFVSVYSKPLLEFYLNNYKIKHLIKLDNSLAFSDGSEFKEIVFAASKSQPRSDHKIIFSIASSTSKKLNMVESISVSPKDLYHNWNWLKYFENPHLLSLERYMLSQNLILSGKELKLNIIRGVEMYGPNFFCIPNIIWKIKTKSDNNITLQSNPNLTIGQPGLHYFALILANNLLKSNGKVVSILPAATFVSVYSKPLLEFYLNNYKIKHLIKLDNSLAFSDGSEFKEIVFAASKSQPRSDHKIIFSIASSTSKKLNMVESISVSPKDLYHNWNWLKYFENPHLLSLERYMLSQNLILSGKELKLNIIRGVEMYGPNFFCIPNIIWKIKTKSDNNITLQSNPNLTIGQPGLHYFALILANNLLKSNGKVVSILPAATFVSVYSKPLL